MSRYVSDSETTPNECAVCSTPCVEMYCSQDCYLVGTGKGFACACCNTVKVFSSYTKITFRELGYAYCTSVCARKASRKKGEDWDTPVACRMCGAPVCLVKARRQKWLKNRYTYCTVSCANKYRYKDKK